MLYSQPNINTPFDCYKNPILTVIFYISVFAVQSFHEGPESKSVTVNSTVIFKCVIKNKKGECQWTHNGFALGSERDYSGYDRFSVIGGQSALGTDIIGN